MDKQPSIDDMQNTDNKGDETRTLFPVYLTEREKSVIKSAAHHHEKSMSSYIRELVLEDAREKTGTPAGGDH